MSDEQFALSPSLAAPPPTEADYEAILAAVMETVRGRWFLSEFSRRNRQADTRLVLAAIERLESTMRGERESPSIERIRFDIREMARAINLTKREIAAIKPDHEHAGRIGEATEELDSIVQTTEQATSDILAAAEQVQETAWTLREQGVDAASCDQLDRRSTDIYLACSFQDLTGQRIRKVIHVLGYLEGRINTMVEILGADEPEASSAEAGTDTGLDGHGGHFDTTLDQAEIDEVVPTTHAARMGPDVHHTTVDVIIDHDPVAAHADAGAPDPVAFAAPATDSEPTAAALASSDDTVSASTPDVAPALVTADDETPTTDVSAHGASPEPILAALAVLDAAPPDIVEEEAPETDVGPSLAAEIEPEHLSGAVPVESGEPIPVEPAESHATSADLAATAEVVDATERMELTDVAEPVAVAVEDAPETSVEPPLAALIVPEPLSGAEQAESGEPAPVEPAESRATSTEMAEPTEVVDATERVELTDIAEPVDIAEPADAPEASGITAQLELVQSAALETVGVAEPVGVVENPTETAETAGDAEPLAFAEPPETATEPGPLATSAAPPADEATTQPHESDEAFAFETLMAERPAEVAPEISPPAEPESTDAPVARSDDHSAPSEPAGEPTYDFALLDHSAPSGDEAAASTEGDEVETPVAGDAEPAPQAAGWAADETTAPAALATHEGDEGSASPAEATHADDMVPPEVAQPAEQPAPDGSAEPLALYRPVTIDTQALLADLLSIIRPQSQDPQSQDQDSQDLQSQHAQSETKAEGPPADMPALSAAQPAEAADQTRGDLRSHGDDLSPPDLSPPDDLAPHDLEIAAASEAGPAESEAVVAVISPQYDFVASLSKELLAPESSAEFETPIAQEVGHPAAPDIAMAEPTSSALSEFGPDQPLASGSIVEAPADDPGERDGPEQDDFVLPDVMLVQSQLAQAHDRPAAPDAAMAESAPGTPPESLAAHSSDDAAANIGLPPTEEPPTERAFGHAAGLLDRPEIVEPGLLSAEFEIVATDEKPLDTAGQEAATESEALAPPLVTLGIAAEETEPEAADDTGLFVEENDGSPPAQVATAKPALPDLDLPEMDVVAIDVDEARGGPDDDPADDIFLPLAEPLVPAAPAAALSAGKDRSSADETATTSMEPLPPPPLLATPFIYSASTGPAATIVEVPLVEAATSIEVPAVSMAEPAMASASPAAGQHTAETPLPGPVFAASWIDQGLSRPTARPAALVASTDPLAAIAALSTEEKIALFS